MRFLSVLTSGCKDRFQPYTKIYVINMGFLEMDGQSISKALAEKWQRPKPLAFIGLHQLILFVLVETL